MRIPSDDEDALAPAGRDTALSLLFPDALPGHWHVRSGTPPFWKIIERCPCREAITVCECGWAYKKKDRARAKAMFAADHAEIDPEVVFNNDPHNSVRCQLCKSGCTRQNNRTNQCDGRWYRGLEERSLCPAHRSGAGDRAKANDMPRVTNKIVDELHERSEEDRGAILRKLDRDSRSLIQSLLSERYTNAETVSDDARKAAPQESAAVPEAFVVAPVTIPAPDELVHLFRDLRLAPGPVDNTVVSPFHIPSLDILSAAIGTQRPWKVAVTNENACADHNDRANVPTMPIRLPEQPGQPAFLLMWQRMTCLFRGICFRESCPTVRQIGVAVGNEGLLVSCSNRSGRVVTTVHFDWGVYTALSNSGVLQSPIATHMKWIDETLCWMFTEIRDDSVDRIRVRAVIRAQVGFLASLRDYRGRSLANDPDALLSHAGMISNLFAFIKHILTYREDDSQFYHCTCFESQHARATQVPSDRYFRNLRCRDLLAYMLAELASLYCDVASSAEQAMLHGQHIRIVDSLLCHLMDLQLHFIWPDQRWLLGDLGPVLVTHELNHYPLSLQTWYYLQVWELNLVDSDLYRPLRDLLRSTTSLEDDNEVVPMDLIEPEPGLGYSHTQQNQQGLYGWRAGAQWDPQQATPTYDQLFADMDAMSTTSAFGTGGGSLDTMPRIDLQGYYAGRW